MARKKHSGFKVKGVSMHNEKVRAGRKGGRKRHSRKRA